MMKGAQMACVLNTWQTEEAAADESGEAARPSGISTIAMFKSVYGKPDQSQCNLATTVSYPKLSW